MKTCQHLPVTENTIIKTQVNTLNTSTYQKKTTQENFQNKIIKLSENVLLSVQNTRKPTMMQIGGKS